MNIYETFFSSDQFAVVGASNNRDKFGNKVLRCYLAKNYIVYPVHPSLASIEGVTCYSNVTLLPNNVKSISIVTPPKITEEIIHQAHQAGICNVWLQPGSESETAILQCNKYKINVIANGPCILRYLGWHEF
jgi:predicted CoA-binding protein